MTRGSSRGRRTVQSVLLTAALAGGVVTVPQAAAVAAPTPSASCVNSGGVSYCLLPDLKGYPIASAQTAIQNAGFVPGQLLTAVDYLCDDIGRVLRTDPTASTTFSPPRLYPQGTTVNIYIGSRPPRCF